MKKEYVVKKAAIPMMVAAMLIAAGCADHKSTSDAANPGLVQPQDQQVQPVQQVAYAPPTQTENPGGSPDISSQVMNPGPASASGGSTYTIKTGDTLWRIATTHYGEGKKWKEIAEANPGLDASKLKVGQTITLP
jgi:nucleoid-associated protein YgaU